MYPLDPDDETHPKTVTFGDVQQTTPKTVTKTSHDLRLTSNDRPVTSNPAPATKTATTGAPITPSPGLTGRSLPSPPRTLQSEDATEQGYSQLLFDFRSSDNSNDADNSDNRKFKRRPFSTHNDGRCVVYPNCSEFYKYRDLH